MGRTDRRLRMVALLLVFVLFGAVATARLAVIGIIDAPELQQRAAARRTVAREELPIRGRILDRNGVVLAHTSFEDRLVAWPSQIGATRQAAIVEDIAAILELDGPARANLQTTLAGGGNYAVLARSVGAEQARAIREAQAAGRLGGLALEPQQVFRQFVGSLDRCSDHVKASQMLNQTVPVHVVAPEDVCQSPEGHPKAAQIQRFFHLVCVAGHIRQNKTGHHPVDCTAAMQADTPNAHRRQFLRWTDIMQAVAVGYLLWKQFWIVRLTACHPLAKRTSVLHHPWVLVTVDG